MFRCCRRVWQCADVGTARWHSALCVLCSCDVHTRSCCLMGKVVSKLKQSLTSIVGAGKFPFNDLPDVCKVQIFSYLGIEDWVSAACVCTEWRHLLCSPVLWTNVDVPSSVRALVSLPQSDKHQKISHHDRVKKYLDFIGKVDPSIRRLVFVGDIAETSYHDSLRSFVTRARLRELRTVDIDWAKVTTVDVSKQHENCIVGAWNVDENHRRRQRHFVHLFEQLCFSAPNVTSLSLPFDWSPRSVDAILRLSKLEELFLSRYSELQALDCSILDRVLAGLSHLRHLQLEVWTPCASGGLTYYSFCSRSLEVVDLSRCRGFAVGHVDLPRLRILKLSRCPWSGPLMVQNTIGVYSSPCLRHILNDGAPTLEEVNGHHLLADWRVHANDEFESLLKSVCPCELHYGWETIVANCF